MPTDACQYFYECTGCGTKLQPRDLLFGGQIGPATKALSARTNSIGVGDKTPDFSLPTAEGGI